MNDIQDETWVTAYQCTRCHAPAIEIMGTPRYNNVICVVCLGVCVNKGTKNIKK